MEQRKIILYIAVSLDGFIADEHGGVSWLDEADVEGDNGFSKFMATVDTVMIGRVTYEQVLSFGGDWPYRGKTVYVFSHHGHAPDANVEFVSGDIGKIVEDIRSRPGSNIYLVGGAELISGFMKEQLIDEYLVFVMPVVLGKGIPMFRGPSPRTWLTLEESRRSNNMALIHFGKEA